jgi:hypothetical protein
MVVHGGAQLSALSVRPRDAMRHHAIACCSLIAACSSGSECPVDLNSSFSAHGYYSELLLRNVTEFPWEQVELFPEYASAEQVRSATGHRYYPDRLFQVADHVRECSVLFVFRLSGGGTCHATWHRDGDYISKMTGDPKVNPSFTIEPVGSRQDISPCT